MWLMLFLDNKTQIIFKNCFFIAFIIWCHDDQQGRGHEREFLIFSIFRREMLNP